MTAFPDLSTLPAEMATDALLTQMFTARLGAPKPWESGLRPEDATVELSDGSKARIWGDPEARSPILLAHGFEGRWRQWARVASAIWTQEGDAAPTVIALEMPGHGEDAAAREAQPNHPLAFSQAIDLAHEAFGPFQAIVGHSQGAVAAMHAVAWGVRAERLALIAPLASIEAHLRGVAALVRLSPPALELFLQKVTRHVGVPPSAFEAARLAPKIIEPSLVIHDREDREADFGAVQALASAWPSAELLVTEGLGHRRILGDLNVAKAVAAFLCAP
ncbi:MAG: hypothetical protein AAF909_10240 [Pseudomonadota bacterium]